MENTASRYEGSIEHIQQAVADSRHGIVCAVRCKNL